MISEYSNNYNYMYIFYMYLATDGITWASSAHLSSSPSYTYIQYTVWTWNTYCYSQVLFNNFPPPPQSFNPTYLNIMKNITDMFYTIIMYVACNNTVFVELSSTLSHPCHLLPGSCLDPPAWIHVDPASGELVLPNLEYAATAVAVPELMELKEAARNEGLLAYYIILSITDTGTEWGHGHISQYCMYEWPSKGK